MANHAHQKNINQDSKQQQFFVPKQQYYLDVHWNNHIGLIIIY